MHYARNGDVRLAYRMFGDTGPVVVWTPGWVIDNVDTIDEPSSPYAKLVTAFSQFMRLVIWDKRGTGLSDPAAQILSLDERMDDLRAVVESVGADQPTILGSGEGGPISILFAATYPERVRSLGIYASAARFSQDLPGFPWGFTSQEVEAQIDDIDQHWGEGALAEVYHGATAEVPGVREMFGKRQRSIASPTTAKLWWQALMEIDVRAVLPAVRAPTLVLARPDDRFVPIEAAAALATAIPNSSFHALRAGAHNGFDILDELITQVTEFVGAEANGPADDRVLKTVLFTDIVSSTERLTAHGDAHWRHQLDSHDTLVSHLLASHDGVRAKHTGDGIFALFDAPTKAARCALDLVPALAARDILIRAGIHTGECERRDQEWSGIAVHTGARIAALAGARELLASRTVRDLSAGSDLLFESLGPQRLKGLPEEVDVYRVTTPTRGLAK
ncbi:hydrolase [Mycobacterium shigaense]|uniref:Hydrolase n=2 Tax=Mycobacterium shigaense TaxID=722731 RepID=A0A1Z4ECK3_9MYCO|nr:hydrolase [Mycobacterium shigaense]